MMKQMAFGVSFLASALAVSSLFGDVRHWAVNADGDTATASNWTEGTAPAAGDDLVFDMTLTAPRTVTVKANDGSVARFGSITGTSLYPNYWLKLGCSMTVEDLAGFFGRVSMPGTSVTLTAAPADGLATVPDLEARLAAPVSVAAGATLVVSNLAAISYVDKKGDGTLRLTRTDGAHHRAIVSAGTLELDPPAPEDGIVGDPYIHVDASAFETFTLEQENGTNFITRWSDVRGGTKPYFTTTTTYTERPFLRPAGGLYATNVVDCGALIGNNGAQPGDVARLGPASSLQLSTASSKIREAFAVFCDTVDEGVNGSFGFIFGSGGFNFHRLENGSLFGQGAANVQMGDIRINDCGVYHNTYVQGSELKVVSVGTAGDTSIDSLAKDRNRIRLGGIRYGEVLLYTNALTSAERTRVNRYLMKKWLRSDEKGDALLETQVAAGTALAVPEGKTAAVRKVRATGDTLVKRGAGTLEIGALRGSTAASKVALTVEAGDVRFGGATNAVPADPQPARAPTFRFDADDETTLTCDGDGNVTRWDDATTVDSWGRYATAASGHTPKRVPSVCNNRAVVDFGRYYGSGDGAFMTIKNASGGDAKQYWLRELFVVWRWNPRPTNANVSPFPLGGSDYSGLHWGDNGTLMTTTGAATSYYGLWTVDGVTVPGNTSVTSNDFHVISVALDEYLGNRQYLFCDRGSCRSGGGQLAEVIGYNRRLSPQERHDTQAYLLKKWKNLPHPDDVSANALGAVTFTGAATPRLVTEDALTVDNVACAATTLEKTGQGTATVLQTGATGFAVREGALVFRNVASVAPAFHVDAATIDAADTFEDGQGTTRVAVWRDANGNGMYAMTNSACTAAPVLVADKWNGLPAVDFGTFTTTVTPTNPDSSSLFWSKEIKVRELFLVVGDHDDDHTKSAFFIGTSMDWHRGEHGQLFCAFTADNVEFGLLQLNGAVVTKDERLADGLNILAVAITNGNAVAANAWANDRQTIRSGGVVIGEALVYDQLLTETERASVIADLERKWRGRLAATSERAVLSAAAGAKLVLSNQFVRVTESLAGGGTVAADGLEVVGTVRPGDAATTAGTLTLNAPTYGVTFADVAELALDVDAEGRWDGVVVNGPVTFAAGGTVRVDLTNAPKITSALTVPVLTATSVTAADQAAWKVVVAPADRYSARLVFDGTTLSVRVRPRGGMAVVVR